MNEQNQRLQIQITETPAPWMPGLYSVQSIPKNPKDPSVTVYRNTVEEALTYLRRTAAAAESRWLLLRHAEAAWDVYGPDGRLVHLCREVSERQRGEVPRVVEVDRDMLDVQAIAATGLPLARICVAEGHAGASAAALSNFVLVSRDVLLEAPEEDIEHFVAVEGNSWDCRVLGLYGNMARLSMKTTDRWLDRYRRLVAEKPLDRSHYLATLKKHLANARIGYLTQIVMSALDISDMEPEESSAIGFFLNTPRDSLACNMAAYVVDTFGQKFAAAKPEAPECVEHSVIIEHAPDIAREARRLIKQPYRTADVT